MTFELLAVAKAQMMHEGMSHFSFLSFFSFFFGGRGGDWRVVFFVLFFFFWGGGGCLTNKHGDQSGKSSL